MLNKDKILNIQNLLLSCNRIIEYSNGYEYSDFIEDYKTFDAVLAQLIHLGETTKVYRDNFGDIEGLPINEMIGMRNFIAHNYLGISPKIIYNVVIIEVPKIKNILESLI